MKNKYKKCETCVFYIDNEGYCLEWEEETPPEHSCDKYALDWTWRDCK